MQSKFKRKSERPLGSDIFCPEHLLLNCLHSLGCPEVSHVCSIWQRLKKFGIHVRLNPCKILCHLRAFSSLSCLWDCPKWSPWYIFIYVYTYIAYNHVYIYIIIYIYIRIHNRIYT